MAEAATKSTVLSECARAFFRVLTARPRQLLKQMLMTMIQFLEIELAMLKMKISANDILKLYYEAQIAAAEAILKPLEAQMASFLAMFPLTELKACPDIKFNLLGNIENIYNDKKRELTSILYKKAQLGFLETYTLDYTNILENKLNKMKQMVEFLDNLASLDFAAGENVYVYTNTVDVDGKKYPVTRKGIFQSWSGTTANIYMNDSKAIEDFNTVGDTTRTLPNGTTVSLGGVVIEPGPA